MLFWKCRNPESRSEINKGTWSIKLAILAFVGKWFMDTLTLVEDHSNQIQDFNPYRLLHIEDDGSFATDTIRKAFRRLSVKYHPDKVNLEKIPIEKATKRYQNL